MNSGYLQTYQTYSCNYVSYSTNDYVFPGVIQQPIVSPLRRCDYCGTQYYEKQEENKALTCPSCGGPR